MSQSHFCEQNNIPCFYTLVLLLNIIYHLVQLLDEYAVKMLFLVTNRDFSILITDIHNHHIISPLPAWKEVQYY